MRLDPLLASGLLVSLSLTAASPATLPPTNPLLSRSELAKRQNFIPCVGTFKSRSLSAAGASLSDRTRIIQGQIPYMTSATTTTEEYWDEAQSDNLLYHYHPEAIVYPKDAQQVAHVVQCAAQNGNIAVAARSGGHSFAGYGSGGQDGSIIVDLRKLADVKSNPQEGYADIGPGARLGDVAKVLWHDGKRAMPHGTCPAVGTGGHAACGGFGPASRLWGMTMDSIIEADVVLANGTSVTISNTQHPELMWALRGAGHFFGIVTRYRFKTHDASGPMTFLEYKWVSSVKDGATVAKLIDAVQQLVLRPDFPAEMGFHVALAPANPQDGDAGYDPTRPQLTVHQRGMYLGPYSDYAKVQSTFFELLKKVGAPIPDTIDTKEVSWIQMVELWDDFGTAGDKLDTVAESKVHNKFVAKTIMSLDHTKALTKTARENIGEGVWQQILDLHRTPKTWSWNIYLELFGGSNAKYRDDQELVRASAFPYRDAFWLVQASVGTVAVGAIDARAHKLAGDLETLFQKAVRDSGSEPVGYGCYTDGDKTRDGSWKRDYYGPSLPRLVRLKHAIDPMNLFRNPQTLGAAPEARLKGTAEGIKQTDGEVIWDPDAGVTEHWDSHPMP